MKQHLSFFALLSAAILTSLSSCSRETVAPASSSLDAVEGMTFTASLSDCGTGTRTSISADGKMTWNMLDRISINGLPYKVVEVSEDSTEAVFAKDTVADDPKPPYIAYYPASLLKNGVPTLPEVQSWSGERGLSGINPMYADESTTELHFKNLCGILELQFQGNIRFPYVEVRAKGDELLSGTFSVERDGSAYRAVVKEGKPYVRLGIKEFDKYPGIRHSDGLWHSYFVALPAGRYSGLEIQLNAGAVFSTDTVIEISRSVRHIIHPDFSFSISSDEEALQHLELCYNRIFGSGICRDEWPLLAAALVGGGPAMDIQMGGSEGLFCRQGQTPEDKFLDEIWVHLYMGINECNAFLSELEAASEVTQDLKKELEGEAKALRGFYYTLLFQTFGKVRLLETGEDYVYFPYFNTPNKAKVETYEEGWDCVIKDLGGAAELLDWKPYNGEYGRATKGMALAFLADAYMWKAYRCPDEKKSCYQKAYDYLDQIMKSGTYSLRDSYSTLWDPYNTEPDCEEIWASRFDPNGQSAAEYRAFRLPNTLNDIVAYPKDLNLSWEWYSAYEKGDKRRDYSCYTGMVPNLSEYTIERSDYIYGNNPFLGDSLKNRSTASFHYRNGGEMLPSIWCSKFWRTAKDGTMPSVPFYWKRYANVFLDMAECCFELGKDADGWSYINALRNRAWGNLEVNKDLTRYTSYYRTIPRTKPLTGYPIPLTEEGVNVPDAKTYYTALQDVANRTGYKHTSAAWKVALNEERRKEFVGEYCLSRDMFRSGYMEDHVNYNYPKDNGGADYANYPWTRRTFEFNMLKLDMPIPKREFEYNDLMVQNEGY